MRDLIFVHGRNANAISWNDVDTEMGGASVTLPGHDKKLIPGTFTELKDDDDSPVTMDDWIAAVAAKFPPTGKVTLIGHSMGGAVISHVAGAFPDRVARLIYVAAMIPDQNQTIREIETLIAQEGVDPLAFLLDFKAIGLDALTALVRQPTGPLSVPFTNRADIAALPRFHIEGTGDNVIPNAVQKVLRGAYGDDIHTALPTGHLPQYEARAALIETLEQIIA